LPRAAFLVALTVMVAEPDPGAAMDLGLKVTVRPFPCPEAEREMAELKPPETAVVTLEAPEDLLATVMEPGEADRVKLG
jgi:hypothetical protein